MNAHTVDQNDREVHAGAIPATHCQCGNRLLSANEEQARRCVFCAIRPLALNLPPFRSVTLGRHAHTHSCGCGAGLSCRVADCAVPSTWQCPNCDQDMQDQYFSRLEAAGVKA